MITTPVTGAVTGPVAGAAAGPECEELAGALEQLVSMWRRLAVPGELSSTAAFTLARLSRDGPCRLTELAAHEKVSQPAMTQLVSRLEGQGLAERCSEPGDARVVNIAVTERGRGGADTASHRDGSGPGQHRGWRQRHAPAADRS